MSLLHIGFIGNIHIWQTFIDKWTNWVDPVGGLEVGG